MDAGFVYDTKRQNKLDQSLFRKCADMILFVPELMNSALTRKTLIQRALKELSLFRI